MPLFLSPAYVPEHLFLFQLYPRYLNSIRRNHFNSEQCQTLRFIVRQIRSHSTKTLFVRDAAFD
jgi:hypothetical protein